MFTENDIKKYGYGKEQGKEFYDDRFENTLHWKEHYKKSRYYPVWKEILHTLTSREVENILEIACGPGQLAHLLSDEGVNNYLGFDFSQHAISMAKQRCPGYNFLVEDAFSTSLLEEYNYDCCITTEFLEHVNADIRVLSSIRCGVFVIATVPNFMSVAHVRCFESIDSVHDRYGSHIDGLSVKEIPITEKKSIYLMSGYRF